MTEYATTESIRRAHALEVHPSSLSRAAKWTDAALSRYAAAPVNRNEPQANVAFRITYASAADPSEPDPAADFAMVAPINRHVLDLAESISLHEDVYGVAIYAVDTEGYPETTPSYAFADGIGFDPANPPE